MTIGKFVPSPVPRNSAVPSTVVEKLECGELKFASVHKDMTTPHAYASALARSIYLRQRGIRAAYRNNYTVPRKGGRPYSHGETILIARGQRVPAGFTVAFG